MASSSMPSRRRRSRRVKDGTPSIPDERAEKMSRSIPLRRLATPDDVAGLVVWLASGANTYVTGETIAFTGGAKT